MSKRINPILESMCLDTLKEKPEDIVKTIPFPLLMHLTPAK